MQTSRIQPRGTITKRAPLSVTIGNEPLIGLYYVNASVGSPPQTVQLQIDTGSSDVWMFGPQSCNSSTSLCLGGDFDPSQSSTVVQVVQGGFTIQYDTPNSGVVGDYVQDNFGIGGMVIKNLTMAVATAADYVTTGIMGIGFDTDESVARASNEGTVYPNLVDELVNQNLITTHSYSLWLNDLSSDSGTVLFGGYDTDKYSGDLGVLQIQPDAQSGNITSMTVAWTSLSVTDPTSGTTTLTDDSFAAPAVLDSGTSLCGVPTDLYNQLADFAAVINDPTYGAIVACNISSYTGTLNFGFGGSGGPIISVPFYELAVPTVDQNNNPLTFDDGSTACTFGLFPVDQGGDILFGDTFLRSAYVVYDLDNLQIGIAPTNFNSTTSSIQVIGASDTIVGGASSIASGVTVTQTNTAKVAPGIEKTGTVTSLATKAPAPTFGAISGIKTDAGATGTAAKAPATATGSAATPSFTKSAASTTTPSFDITTMFIMAGSFILVLLGGVSVVLA
ncbi:hypothetical protein MMC26_004577 [Xylographa opegraphella]|nr:hypothetical protein [Xylographa opegraphella]